MSRYLLDIARSKDEEDALSEYRSIFHRPTSLNGEESIYLCGNSLGLQPISAEKEIEDVLEHWKNRAVEGHFEGENNWINYNDRLKPSLGKLLGATTSEIAIANTLTVNLHLLMISFYQPTSGRYKIIMEKDAFPSDKYAVASQVKMHGLDPSSTIIEVESKTGSPLLTVDDFEDVLFNYKDSVSMVLIGGVNYFTGQVLPIKEIGELCKRMGCYFGVDLAHAVGNIPLHLHDDNVDFAVWCHYKYVNAGPGAIGGFFIHQKHHTKDLKRLEGWWGNNLENRFEMNSTFDPSKGAEAWVMSTPPTLAIAPLKASLEIFDNIGMAKLREKSIQLTSFLEGLVNDIGSKRISIITPTDVAQRGCQLSIAVDNADKQLYHKLMERNVILDWREPNVIRVSPTPLYNSFEDVWTFVKILKELL